MWGWSPEITQKYSMRAWLPGDDAAESDPESEDSQMCVPVIQVRSVDEARSQWKFTGKKLMPLTSTNTKSDGLMKFPITARVGNMKFFFFF